MNLLKQHLRSRHVDLDLHKPVVDEVGGVATFYLWNASGQLVGYQHYRPASDKKPKNNPKEGRYYTCVKYPTVAVFGVESLHLTSKLLFVVEGIFDATRLTEKGVSAVAVLTNNPSQDVFNWLHSLGRTVVTVCDNDDAGRKLAKFGHYSVFTEGKDIGESDELFIETLFKRFL